MTQSAVTDHIDHDVFVESHAKVVSQSTGEYYGVGIIAINVKNWCLNHFSHLSTVRRRAGIKRISGGEADLIIDDDMDSAPG